MSDYNQQVIENDEISLKDLILLLQKYFFVLLRKWWLIGIFAILVGGYFFYSASKKAIIYTATLSYTSGEGGGMSGIGGLLGGFLGKRGGSNPLVKAQAMATTRKIGKEALFKKVEVDGKLDYLINHHGRIYEINEFVSFENNQLQTLDERRLFKNILASVNKLLNQGLDDQSGIATMQMNTLSEEYSIHLVENYYETLVVFYKRTEVDQQQITLNALESRADSIYNLIQSTAYGIARIKDQDKGIFWAADKVPEVQATTELNFLTSAYQEIVKNLEAIKFSIASSTPSITAIDYPMSPISPKKESKLSQGIIGAFIGGFLASLFILGFQILSDIMKNDEDGHLVTTD